MNKEREKSILTVDHANKREDSKKLVYRTRRRSPFRAGETEQPEVQRVITAADKEKTPHQD